MFVTALLVTAAAVVGMLVLLKARKASPIVVKVWFIITMISLIILTSVVTFFIDALRHLGVARPTTQSMCSFAAAICFQIAILLNPQIKVHVDTSDITWAEMKGRCAILVNHTSLLDVFIFISASPATFVANARTLMKATLRNIPVFGPVFDRIGHFPVYFSSNAEGIFSVDKDKQAEVQRNITAHINREGAIAFFPEGQINRDPVNMMSFRHGTFTTILDHKLPTYYCITIGNPRVWGAKGPTGGPADIFVKLGRVDVDFANDTAKDLSCRARDDMQLVLDIMRKDLVET